MGGVSLSVLSVSIFAFFEFRTGFWDKTDKADKTDKVGKTDKVDEKATNQE